MKNSLLLPLAITGQLLAVPALAQGTGKDVTILRMSGPQLGVRLAEVDQDVVTRLKLKEEKGALVTEVLKDSAAEKAGVKEDDVILKFQGQSILTAAQLNRLVRDVPSGRKVDIDLVRGGAPVTVSATIKNKDWSGNAMVMPEVAELSKRLDERMGKMGDLRWKSESREGLLENERPHAFTFKLDEGSPAWNVITRSGRGRLGITYTEIEGQLAKYFKAPSESAVLVESVVAGSAAEKAGIKAGDLLTKLGGSNVKDGSDLQDAVRDLESGKLISITVWRDGKSVDLSVTITDERRTTERRRRPVS
ncbi:MAG: PDZ domain-containing protein [Vicinamibacteria bacterium]|nr:PDZ domain-containing protein [Vicinamibacteria bacterium]